MRGVPAFDQSVFEEIVERVSEGEPLAQVCRDKRMPPLRTVYNWLQADAELTARFALARTAGYDMIAQDALRIADTPIDGVETENTEGGKDGPITKVRRADMIRHRMLQVDTRLKLLAKWDPKRYGDQLSLVGDPERPVTLLDYAAAIAAAKLKAQTNGGT